MKRIDRYITRGYLFRFIAAVLIVFGLYVSFDAVKRIDQIQQGSMAETVPRVLTYYAYQFPTRVLDLVPPLLLVGAGLMLVQMSRRKELLTLKASGVSLRRAIFPVLLATIPIVALSVVTREKVVPWSFRKQNILDRELEKKTSGPFLLKDKEEGFKLFVGQYDFAEHSMYRVSIMRFYPEGGIRRMTEAENGWWGEEGRIYLETVSVNEFDENGAITGKPEVHTSVSIKTSLDSYDFVEAKGDAMSTTLPAATIEDLWEQVRQNPDNPRFRVMFHSRLAKPLAPFVLLLIGIPLLIGFEHTLQSRVLGAVVCIVVAAVYHVLSFVAISMGNTGAIHPIWAAWSMPVIGIGVGLFLFSRMRT